MRRGYCSVCLCSLVIFTGVIISGCVTIKAPSDPKKFWEPPKNERSIKEKDTAWEELRNRKIDSAKAYTMEELIEVALENNPTTRKALEDARAANMRVKEAQSTWYPQVSGTFGPQYDRRVYNKHIEGIDQSSYGPNGSISLLVLDFGGRDASVKGAVHELISSNYQFNQTVQDVIWNAEKAYYNLYTAQALVVAAQKDTDDNKVALDAVQARFNAGLVTQLDVLQAKSQYDRTVYDLENAKGNLETSQDNLAQVLGFPGDTKIAIKDPPDKLDIDITKDEIRFTIDRAIQNRSDILAARATVRAKEQALRQAFSNILPTLNVGGSADSNWFKYYGETKSVTTNYKEYYEYSGYLTVNWNIFDGFSNYSKMKEAEAQFRAEKQTLIQKEIAASSDVWDKYYAFKTAQSKHVASESFLKNSEGSYNLALEGYKAGLKNILDLLNSETQLADARSKYIKSRNEVFTALVDLAHATGVTGREEDAKKALAEARAKREKDAKK